MVGAVIVVWELHNTLGLHSIGDLDETGNVCTGNVVAFHAVFLGSVVQIVENVDHDGLQLRIHFLEAPGKIR